MNFKRPSGFPTHTASILFALFAASACSSLPDAPANLPPSERPTYERQRPTSAGPSEEVFLGQPVRKLEAAIGQAALIRKEGNTEFRRYDLGDCRAYAVITSKGTVKSITTGPARMGASPQPFSYCSGWAVKR